MSLQCGNSFFKNLAAYAKEREADFKNKDYKYKPILAHQTVLGSAQVILKDRDNKGVTHETRQSNK